MRYISRWIVVVGMSCVGCGQSTSVSPTANTSNPSADSYLLSESPPGAIGVIAARENATEDQPVTVTGRIGGSEDPWVQDRAAFTIVDLSLQACNDTMADHCATPWDYCCEATLPQARVLVKVVDSNEQLVKSDARELLGVKELQTLVVHGTAKRDDAGNLSILAKQIYIEKP